MRLIQGIDFFYHDESRNQLIIGSRGLLYGAKRSPEDLLSLLCEAYGRSMKGSMEIFAKINQAHQKLAVLVNPLSQKIYFPTHASINKDCIWINCGKVRQFQKIHQNHCLIEFNSGCRLEVKCSVRVVSRQMKRCVRVLNSLCNPYEQINDLFSLIGSPSQL